MVRSGSKGKMLCRLMVAVLLALPAAQPAAAETDGQRIRELERQIEELRQALAGLQAKAELEDSALRDAERLDELDRRLDVLAAEIERMKVGEAAAQADVAEYGLGPAASKIYRTGRGASIGGYGEMLFQNPSSSRDDGSESGTASQLDFQRAVVYLGYKFGDNWLLNSEIEFEHASTSKAGDVSVEFAYLDRLVRPEINARVGMLLVPMGFLNELHEPTTFLGAKRPDIERVIIPTTWRENGLGAFGNTGSVTYRTYVVAGLDAQGFSADGLRGGRQKGSRSRAEDFAWVGRLDYKGTPGLLLGGSAYIGDSGQGLSLDGRQVAVGTTLYEGHLEWRRRGLEFRALGVRAELDDVAELNQALGLTGSESVAEELKGFYLQVAYDVLSPFSRGNRELAPFLRYESYDTQAEVPEGFSRDPANDVESWTLGLNFQPIDRVVLKVDYQDVDNEAGTGVDQFNVSVGYIF
jgi:hypothetical protein